MSLSSELSPADIRACTCNENNGCNNGIGFGGDGIVGLIALLIVGSMFGFGGGFGGFGGGGILPWLLFNGGFNGGGFGGNGAQNVESAVQRGFDNQSVINKLNGLENGLCDGFYAVNTAFGTMANTLNQNTAQLQNSMNQGFNGLNTAIVSQGYESRLATQGVQAQLADCCCGIKGDIKDNTTQGVMNTAAIQASIKDCCCENEKIALNAQYTAAQQNCATLQAIDKLGDRIIEFMCAEKTQALRDENQALRLAASQQAQNAYLVQQLAPKCPQPAYLTCNPYTGQTYTNGYPCGANNGCGC